MATFNENLLELKNSINSILNQDYYNIEFIIIDDNPNSIKNRKYLLNISNKDDRIKLIFNKKNIGAIKSRNKGLNCAKGNYIAIMDADDISKKNRLSSQLKFLKNNNLDLVCSNFSNFNDYRIIEKNCYSNNTQIKQKIIKNALKYFNIAMGPTLFFKNSILKDVNNYRNILVEDYDFVVRILTYGYKVGYQSESLLYKKIRTNNLSVINSLEEFVIVDTISKYLRKYNFTKIMPLSLIDHSLKKVSKHDKKCYDDFLISSLKLKNKWSLFNYLKMYFSILSSKIVFKRNVWMVFINKKQDKFL